MVREFRQTTRTKKINRWRIWQEGCEVCFQDGFVGGKLKIATAHLFDESLNKGKVNEKNPEQQAIEFMDRQILLKTRKGYREINLETGQYPPCVEINDWSGDQILTFKTLPRELRFYKPQNNVNPHMKKMMENGKAVWLRKRDGNMHIYVIDEAMNHYMVSSTMATHQKDEEGNPEKTIIKRYPQVEKAMRDACLPPKSIFLGEICCVDAGGHSDKYRFDIDSRDITNGVRGSLTDYAFELQQEHGRLGFIIWDIAFWDGECLMHTVPICDRIEMVKPISTISRWVSYPEIARYDKDENIITIDSLAGKFEFKIHPKHDVAQNMLDLAIELGWEGWVVVDPKCTYGDRAYNFRGKSERPKNCVKSKPKKEADFIVRYDPALGVGKKGKGRKSIGVGSAQASLMHPEKGEIPIAFVGNGLSEEEVLKFADLKLYPMVWEVEFEDWTKDGSLTHPRFLCVRDDKTPGECLVDQNPDWEEHYS